MAKKLVPVLAVPRGRVFWRLTATSRRTEVVSVAGDQPSPTPGTRTRSPRRRTVLHVVRAVAGGGGARLQEPRPMLPIAPETPKVGENLGQVPGSSLA